MSELSSPFQPEQAVRERYSAAANDVEPALCCPVKYDPKLLAVLPPEILERDYGCGDPSKYVRKGDVVLDLGSGGGKICYLASQLVGAEGEVIGVDINDEMLALARKYRQQVGERIGWHNVSFRKGRIQDLALDVDALQAHLAEHPATDAASFLELERWCTLQREQQPLVPSNSVDVVLSNCVLNLVTPAARHQLFHEIFRVLKPGGRAVISDIVSDRPVPAVMQCDAHLWSGCISGAFEEGAFLNAFAAAGFIAVEAIERQENPWQVVDGIAFRSLTVRAYKSPESTANPDAIEQSPFWVMYRGPWASVTDEQGRRFERGVSQQIDEEAMRRLQLPAYRNQFSSNGGNDTADSATGGTQKLPLVADECCSEGKCC